MAQRVVRTRSADAEARSPIAGILSRRLRVGRTASAVVFTPPTQPQIVASPPSELGPLSDILMRSRSVPRRGRADEYVHVSDLLFKCQRKVAILDRHSMPLMGGNLSLSEELTFAQGDAIHDVLKRRSVLGAPDKVWGKWRCSCKSLQIERPCLYTDIPSQTCANCGERPSVYVEVPMLSEELHLVGTPDLLLWVATARAYFITELKSIAHDHWKELVRPQPDHVLQVVFYWHLMRELGYSLLDTVSVVYATKSMVFRGPPQKEFIINPLDEIHRLEPYIAEARALKAAREGGALPVRTCATTDCATAKACEVCTICFALP